MYWPLSKRITFLISELFNFIYASDSLYMYGHLSMGGIFGSGSQYFNSVSKTSKSARLKDSLEQYIPIRIYLKKNKPKIQFA